MSQPNNKKLKIMILEDEEDILILYKDFLAGKGHEITTTYQFRLADTLLVTLGTMIVVANKNSISIQCSQFLNIRT